MKGQMQIVEERTAVGRYDDGLRLGKRQSIVRHVIIMRRHHLHEFLVDPSHELEAHVIDIFIFRSSHADTLHETAYAQNVSKQSLQFCQYASVLSRCPAFAVLMCASICCDAEAYAVNPGV